MSLANNANSRENLVQEKRQQFGTRFLTNNDDVFQHNAWDAVEWDEAREEDAAKQVALNSSQLMDVRLAGDLEANAQHYWNEFYKIHENRFFKDRHWLFTEFPHHLGTTTPNNGTSIKKLLEIGCGVGNTVFPLLQYNSSLLIYCCDFSQKALDVLQENEAFNAEKIVPFHLDITENDWTKNTGQVPFGDGTLDVALLMFVLSSISPDRMSTVLRNIYRYLKPGGCILFRDYGRYDLAQLRFKSGRAIAENFYGRGDNTRVYFFTKTDVKRLFEQCGFLEEQIYVDQRLQVNRRRLLNMYRVWIQAVYKKPN